MIFGLFRRSSNKALIDKLHGEIMTAARQPALYDDFGVPDTFEGRFEMLVLHGVLAVRRINRLPEPGPDLAQDLTDGIFRHLDATLREMGVGDLAVPKRMKKHAEAFAGRGHAYGEPLEAHDDAALRLALARNVHGDETRAEDLQIAALAAYVHRVEATLAGYDLAHFAAGRIGFPEAGATGAAR